MNGQRVDARATNGNGSLDPFGLSTDVSGPLAALREAVNDARSMPMSSSVVVHRSELLELIDRVEAVCLSSVEAAQQVVGQRDAVVEAGLHDASEMIREARFERDRLVSDTEVFRVATREAERTVSAAADEAEALLEDTDAYVAQRLAAFEDALEGTLEAVRRGRARLEKKPKQPRRPGGTSPDGSGGPFAALADDSDVDDISLPEHLDR